LGLERLDDAMKDPDRFPAFDPALADMMREQTERFVARTLAGQQLPLEALLTSRDVVMTPQLASVYGMDHDASTLWQEATLPVTERAGLLSHASLLTIGAHHLEGSPALRGVDVLRRMLCIEPQPPPSGADTTLPNGADDAKPRTNRERFEAHVAAPQCMACHQSFDPIGYALESYDAVGRYRTTDAGLPVNTRAELTLPGELGGPVDGPVALSEKLASSRSYALCVTEKLSRFARARQLGPGDRCQLEQDREHVAAAGNSYLAMLLRDVRRDDFILRPKTPPAADLAASDGEKN
jgi:hypothetical protein